MKPMFRVFSFTVLTSTLLFSSCVKDLYDPEVIAEKNPDAEIPVGFKFTTIKNVNLTVNVDDQYNGQYFYKVEVYNQNPLSVNNNMKLLTAGVAKGNSPFVEEIVVPLQDSILYIKQIDPLQREIVKVVDISSVTTAVCDFSNNTITTKSVFSSVVTSRAIPSPSEKATAYPLPDNRITLGSGAITLAANTKYYLPYGFTNNQITFEGGRNNIELYVEGSTTFSNTFSLTDGCKIIVLPKGKVVANAGLNWYGNDVVVAIHEGGSFNINSDASFGKNNKVINDGSIVTKNLIMDNNAKVINNGTFTTPNIQVTNNSVLENNNVFVVNELKGNSNTKLVNNGDLKATSISLTNTFTIDNNHHIEVSYLYFNYNGTLNNNCFVVCDDLRIGGGTINSASGSLLACKDFWGQNSTFTLRGNAIFSIGDVAAYNLAISNALTGSVFENSVVVNGVSENGLRPLFYVKSGSMTGGEKTLSLKGSLDAAITPSYNANLLKVESESVKLSKEPQTAIAETACNGSGATEDPGTGTPTNPSFPIKVETGNAYTFAMEDNWPALGDYDMNDFVFTIDNISYTKDNKNKPLKMSFDITPIAAGATNRLALGIQFDKVSSSNLSSVGSTDGIGVKESGQDKANIILFPNVYSTFGLSSPSITNTNASKTKYTSKTYNYEVLFNNSISESDINISNLNFYLIVGQNKDLNRKEIHLAGYKPTSKVKSDPLDYTDYNNMVWGLLIPTADFKYPFESVKIQDAYPNFLNWAKSGGANNSNWYLSPQSGKVYN
ncbi:LruC domain-containing protein [Macellibacteroides fermentans]|uniref:LruC domain-containing protein n=1 Tax=Macellibacteroides fermentans TaxID=879969 RepID=UPI003B92A0ED